MAGCPLLAALSWLRSPGCPLLPAPPALPPSPHLQHASSDHLCHRRLVAADVDAGDNLGAALHPPLAVQQRDDLLRPEAAAVEAGLGESVPQLLHALHSMA